MRTGTAAVAFACLAWTALVVADVPDAEPGLAPRWLSETGLFDADVHRFTPQYPLWTDGAVKARWIQLPPGAAIDAHDIDRWVFPVGTKLWKEFAFDGRRVETRFIWRADVDTWVMAAYVWNDAQTDAALAPAGGVPGIVEAAPGRRHSVPGVTDCQACHDPGTGRQVLGVTALQLSPARDPLALHAELPGDDDLTLTDLVNRGWLDGAPDDLLADAPAIRADRPETRALLGYLAGNCGHCHNDEGSLASLRLNLSQPARGPAWDDEALAVRLGGPTDWRRPGAAPGETVAVEPHAPELSALWLRMRSRQPSSQMPPLGTVVRDQAAVELLEAWILGLPRGSVAAERETR